MPVASGLDRSSFTDMPFGGVPRLGPCSNFCSGFVLFLVSGFFCVVQSGMGASLQCPFPEMGGVEGEGTELPERRGLGVALSLCLEGEQGRQYCASVRGCCRASWDGGCEGVSAADTHLLE